jgi:hypothetical protein
MNQTFVVGRYWVNFANVTHAVYHSASEVDLHLVSPGGDGEARVIPLAGEDAGQATLILQALARNSAEWLAENLVATESAGPGRPESETAAIGRWLEILMPY